MLRIRSLVAIVAIAAIAALVAPVADPPGPAEPASAAAAACTGTASAPWLTGTACGIKHGSARWTVRFKPKFGCVRLYYRKTTGINYIKGTYCAPYTWSSYISTTGTISRIWLSPSGTPGSKAYVYYAS